MYQGQKDYRTYYPLEVTDVCYQDASQDGLWYPCRKPGDMIHRGEKLGEVRDYQGNIKEISIAEFGGVILYQTGSLQVMGDSPMIAYGKVVNPMTSARNVSSTTGKNGAVIFSLTKERNFTAHGGALDEGDTGAASRRGTSPDPGCGLRKRDFSLFFWRKKDTG